MAASRPIASGPAPRAMANAASTTPPVHAPARLAHAESATSDRSPAASSSAEIDETGRSCISVRRPAVGANHSARNDGATALSATRVPLRVRVEAGMGHAERSFQGLKDEPNENE